MLGWWRFRAAAQIFEKIKILKELRRHSMQTKFVIVLLSALLPVSVQRANAQGAVTIQSATANANQTVLTISGSNYCGSPAVTLGGVSLTVTGATSVQITAKLSAVSPGTYYLVVSCGTLAGRTAYFDVTVGAAAAGQTTTASGGCWVNGQRYADCGNGTIADSMTGLIWLKDAACAALGVPDLRPRTRRSADSTMAGAGCRTVRPLAIGACRPEWNGWRQCKARSASSRSSRRIAPLRR
jgi:hypothetical protein